MVEDYGVISNLLPEIAGIVVVGRAVLEYLIVPISKLNFYTNIIQIMFLAKTGTESETSQLVLPAD